MRFVIPLAVDLDDHQLDTWAKATRVAREDAEYAIRAQILAGVAAEFKALGVRAQVTIDGGPVNRR